MGVQIVPDGRDAPFGNDAWTEGVYPVAPGEVKDPAGRAGGRLRGRQESGSERGRSMVQRMISGLAITALIVVGFAAPAAAGGPKDKTQMFDFTTEEPISGTFSMLERTDDGVATKIRTRVEPGDAYTVWYVIFNAPQNCNTGACGEDDIFNPDGSFNVVQIEAARIAAVWANAGGVANPAGRLNLEGGLAEGEVPDGENQVLIGRGEDNAVVPLGVVSWLEDASAAEVHIVLETHGPAHEDPDLLQEQITSFQGACNPDCADTQFAVHLP